MTASPRSTNSPHSLAQSNNNGCHTLTLQSQDHTLSTLCGSCVSQDLCLVPAESSSGVKCQVP